MRTLGNSEINVHKTEKQNGQDRNVMVYEVVQRHLPGSVYS